jgi:polysaccharide export outer membrane protein
LSTSLNLSESKIYVEGEVQDPGAYDYQEGMTALSACIMAGGFSKFAAPNRARIIRQDGDEQKVIKIDLDDVKIGKIQDIKILPGDRIHIPETWL